MTTKEVREYRVLSKRLVEVEERSRLLEKLIARQLGLAEEEGFIMKEAAKHRIKGKGSKIKIEQRREAQHDKLRDEIRTMHEAYQFLAQKYRNDKARNEEKASDKKPSSELTDDMRNGNDKEEPADEVFCMGAILSPQSV